MHAPMRNRAGRLVGAAIVAAGLTLSLSITSALAGGPGNPGGNNGTVKVHESTTNVEMRRNEPHVCTFYLAFYSSDAGESGTWEIRDWSPGGSGTVVESGTYLTDAEGFYRTQDMALDDGHYRVNWQGINDTTWKHKMFWVDCADDQEEDEQPGEQPGEEPGEQPGEGGEQGDTSGDGQGDVAASQGGPGAGELPDAAMEPVGTGNGPAIALGVLLVTIATAMAAADRRQRTWSE